MAIGFMLKWVIHSLGRGHRVLGWLGDVEVDLVLQSETVQTKDELDVLHQLLDVELGALGQGRGARGRAGHSGRGLTTGQFQKSLRAVEVCLAAAGEQEDQIEGGLGLARSENQRSFIEKERLIKGSPERKHES